MTIPPKNMAAFYQIIFITFFTFNFIVNAVKQSPKHTLNRISYRQNIKDKNILQKWEFELDDRLEYPRGDTEKLYQISAQWSEYYECSSRLARRATAAARLPSIAAAVYEDAIARLPCGLCVAPAGSSVQWMYQQQQSSFTPLTLDERIVVADNGNLTIFKVRSEDAGAYKCTIGHSAGGTVLLDVVDRGEPYDVVKPFTSRGQYPKSEESIRLGNIALSVFTLWAPWSECSVCGSVGRRRRYGMCFVKAKKEFRREVIYTTSDGLEFRTANKLKIFKDFPDGIPCRNSLLPLRIRSLPAVAQRRNEIMIGLCKVPCEDITVFEVRSSNGAVLERANNTAGVYSLSQRLPPEPPSPSFESVFALRGQKVVLVCPGTSLRDIPLTWRVGTKKLVPREVDKASGGRAHLNARDDLVFTEVIYSDANLYSCWHRHALLGTVQLSVNEACPWRRRAVLLAAVLTAALALRALDDYARRRKRRVML